MPLTEWNINWNYLSLNVKSEWMRRVCSIYPGIDLAIKHTAVNKIQLNYPHLI